MSGNLTRRVADLELAVASQQQPGRSEASRKLRAVLNELAKLKASAATRQVAGKVVEGLDTPRQILGDGYTGEQLVELAASRTADAGLIEHDEVPDVVAAFLAVCEPYQDPGDRGEGGR